MPEGAEDDPDGDVPSAETELGAAVDDAMALELKRQRARFVQQIVGLDRSEGVGRGEARRDDSSYRDLGVDEQDGSTD